MNIRHVLVLGSLVVAVFLAALASLRLHTAPSAEAEDGPVRTHGVVMGAAQRSAGERSETLRPVSATSKLAEGASISAPSAVPIGRRWNESLNDSENYRVFVKQALDSPASGGYFYALEAKVHCIQFSTIEREFSVGVARGTEPIKLEALKRVQAMVVRCESLAAQFGGEMELIRLALRREQGRASPDPLLELSEAVVQASDSDSEALRKLWRQARSLGDPRLTAQLLPRVAASIAPELAGLQGQDPIQRRLLDIAVLLASCELVGDCIGGPTALAQCLSTTPCVSLDLREQLLAGAPANQRSQVERTAARLKGLAQ